MAIFSETFINVIMILLVVALIFCFSVGLTMIGWHFFMVPVFGLPQITFLQAWGLNLLLNFGIGGVKTFIKK